MFAAPQRITDAGIKLMAPRAPKNFEIFRLLTPVLITLCLTLLSAIWSDLNKVKDAVVKLQIDVATVQTEIKDRSR